MTMQLCNYDMDLIMDAIIYRHEYDFVIKNHPSSFDTPLEIQKTTRTNYYKLLSSQHGISVYRPDAIRCFITNSSMK